MNMKVRIDSLITEGLQIRVTLNQDVINEYAEDMRRGEEFPPVVVFFEKAEVEGGGGQRCNRFYLADGFHRVSAANLNGYTEILAEVHEGGFNDARKFALTANAKHGLRRTNADKHNALEIAWKNWRTLLTEAPNGQTDGKPNGLPSKRQLAALCRVHPDTAGEYIKLARVADSATPQVSKVTGEEMLATLPSDKIGSAVTVTNHHLEERNESVSRLLKDGKDRYGLAIPEHLREVFKSREPHAFIRDFGVLYKKLEDYRLKGTAVFAPFIAYAMRDLETTIRDIRAGLPHCVCPMCRGRGCGSCSDLGFQTKRQYDRVPAEFKGEM